MLAALSEFDGQPAALAQQLRALVPDGDSVAAAVAEILADVRSGGERAVRHHTRLHDTRGADPKPLRVTRSELAQARAELDPEVAAGIELAITNVGQVARAALHADRRVDFGGHSVTVRETPVHRAAVYVPGGRAPYPSTVVMGVATARAAGVQTVAVCSPPGPDGDLNPAILAACELAGADEVYRMGGAQGVAALAYGTEQIEPVDVIVGPGNLYVQEAKRQLSGIVGIDSFAGPSDMLAIVDPQYPLEPLALDLLAQAEHGAGTIVVAVCPDAALLDALAERLAAEPLATDAVCRLVHAPTYELALAIAEAFAPEHLELLGPLAEQLAPRITRSGCVFIGTGTAFGDYVAGSNHTLPTGGAARFASTLGPHHFRRVFTEVRIEQPRALAQAAAPLARAEGFEYHARSMEARIGENQS
ncbi:histidinol dehydrogenase [Conexibacter sp. S30A1]|uniref:histidinol dehydrogenase n=1 Tax=Conexibacter sp. S30A1 TaxID=2937800 RepID=UPI00200FC299|nr:histidinol dehydrogenase [Conexibacter sp. S30A1]